MAARTKLTFASAPMSFHGLPGDQHGVGPFLVLRIQVGVIQRQRQIVGRRDDRFQLALGMRASAAFWIAVAMPTPGTSSASVTVSSSNGMEVDAKVARKLKPPAR